MEYLENLWEDDYTTDRIYNLIKEKYNNIPKPNKKNEQIYMRLIAVFFGLYNSENEEDLIVWLETEFTWMNRDEIIELVEKIKSELEDATGINLDICWVNKKAEEMEEFIKLNENLEVKEHSVFMINNNVFIESVKTIINFLIQKFYSSEISDSLNTSTSNIIDDLLLKKLKIKIPEKLSDYDIAGAVFYFVNSVHGTKTISYNQIYDSFNPPLVISKEGYRKHAAELYQLLVKEYRKSFDELVLEKINFILDNVEELSEEDRIMLTEKSKEILKELLNPKSEKSLKISSNTKPEMLASMILYLISRILEEYQFLDGALIGEIIGIERTDIVSNFHRSLKERYIDELKDANDRIARSREEFLRCYINKYEIPNYCEKFAFKILNLIQDDNIGNYIDKTVALTIIYITSQVCDGFKLPLERLCSQESASDSSIYGCVKLFIPYLENFIKKSEEMNNLKDFNIDFIELKLLTYDTYLEKIKFCIDFIIDKLRFRLRKNCSDFSLKLIESLIESGYKIQPKELRSLAGKAVYLGINFFELQGESNIYPYMKIIGTLINIHKDRIETQGNKLKPHFKKLSFKLACKYAYALFEYFSFSKLCLEKVNSILSLMYDNWWARTNPTFNFTISISPVSVYLASILTEKLEGSIRMKEFIEKSLKIIPTLTQSHFESQLSAVTNYLPNKDFLKIIAFIYKNDIFPLIRVKEEIPLDKAPLFSDIHNNTPFYYHLVTKRNYRYVEESIYYEDIITELGFDVTSKSTSKYFPYIGMGVATPKVARLEKLSSFKKLQEHIEAVYQEQGFPPSITSKIVQAMKDGINIPRISTFKVKGVRYKQRLEFERKFVKPQIEFEEGLVKLENGFIKKINPPNIYTDYSNPEHYKEEYILGHGQPEHNAVMNELLKHLKSSVITEMPIWINYSSSYLTGHIDMLEIENKQIKVGDYKPKSFFHSIPQIAVYAIVIKKSFNIKKIKCIIFNKDRVWEFEPNSTLKNVMKFLKSLNVELFWFEYANYLLNNQ